MKYVFTMMFLITNQGLQVALIIHGSRKEHYFSYDKEDGFKRIRFVSKIQLYQLLSYRLI